MHGENMKLAKVKFDNMYATKVYRGGRGIALPIPNLDITQK